MTAPALTAASRASATAAALVAGAVAGDVDHLAVGLDPAFGEKPHGEIERRADRRAAEEGARRSEQRGGEFRRVGRIAQHRPVDDDRLLALARPFDIGERDRAMRARADRLHQLVADDRRRIAAALQVEFVVVDAARHVGREHDRRVDRLVAARRRRRGEEQREDRQAKTRTRRPDASDAPARAPRQRAERRRSAASIQVRVKAIGAVHGVRSNSSQFESSVRPCAAKE